MLFWGKNSERTGQVKELAEALRTAMDEKGHSYHKAATVMGVSVNSVRNWANGFLMRRPDTDYNVIATYIGVEVEIVMGWFNLLTPTQVDTLIKAKGLLLTWPGLAMSRPVELIAS